MKGHNIIGAHYNMAFRAMQNPSNQLRYFTSRVKTVQIVFFMDYQKIKILSADHHIRASNCVSEDFKLRIKLKNKFLPRPKSASPI